MGPQLSLLWGRCPFSRTLGGACVLFRILADITTIVHFAFIIFVIAGGVVVLRWRRVMWAHLPVVAYGILIEFLGWVCPLTPLEQSLRTMAGQTSYTGTFTEHYITPIIYPPGLSHSVQITLGLIVFAVNAAVYIWIFSHRRRKTAEGGS